MLSARHVNTEQNGGNLSTMTEPAPGPLMFDIEEMGKKDQRWRLEVRPGDLALYEGENPHPFVILREQFQKDAMLIEGIPALTLKRPKKLTFKLKPEANSAVADWIGKSVLAALYLKRRYAWVLPVAIIWTFGSLPIAGNPQIGAKAQPLDAMGLGLGVVLLVSWAFARWRPHPMLFLVDSIWFLWLAGYLIYDVVNGRSKLWLLLIAFLLWMVVTGFKHFARFRGTRLTQ